MLSIDRMLPSRICKSTFSVITRWQQAALRLVRAHQCSQIKGSLRRSLEQQSPRGLSNDLQQNRHVSNLQTEVKSAQISEFAGKSTLQLVWEDNTCSHFPFVFLRDNCQCSSCFEKSALQRLYHFSSLNDFDIRAHSISFNLSEQAVTVTWPDGHTSVFQATWLRERKFPESRYEQLQNSLDFFPKKEPWGNAKDMKVHDVDFQSVIEDDGVRYKWLYKMATDGLTLIKNVPAEPNQLNKIAEKVGGYIRQTHYGTVFKVMTKPNPSNIAYSGHEIPLHVDLAYYSYQPCVQLLHCIEQTMDPVGGDSYFVDGFSIANYFRSKHPEIFQILTTMKVTYRDIGKDEYGEFEKKLERPVIGIDEHGSYTSIAQNNFTRSSFLNLQLPEVLEFYKAYLLWTEEINKQENQIRHKLQPGEMWAFDNLRMLHARTKYDQNVSSRYVEGLYLDWDEVYSTIRTLRRKLGLVTGDCNSFANN